MKQKVHSRERERERERERAVCVTVMNEEDVDGRLERMLVCNE